MNPFFAGIDVGSVTAKAAVISAKGRPSIESDSLTRLGALQAGIIRTAETAKRTFEIVKVPALVEEKMPEPEPQISLRP